VLHIIINDDDGEFQNRVFGLANIRISALNFAQASLRAKRGNFSIEIASVVPPSQ